ncbi:MAG: crossover junction endodeoxyribonuclease RuvC [candidate division Zixibacteria bacterium]|nr:crossover junction endodeoxyribonuclease RuvC [candidate division Zixibacteria bacterium]MBU1471947.1 crossover junction endodeoxyribonuclease RuvC [candidate division Zixibacteria bacterium]
MPDEVLILGIDPALSVTGYGIIGVNGDDLRLISYGEIRTNDRNELAYRLHRIYSGIREVVQNHRPSLAVLEEGFYSKNVKIALGLGQARGAAMVACAECGLEVKLFAAREIKQAVAGRGSASKEQVAYMVKARLQIEDGVIDSLDITDSLGAALCAAQKLDMESHDVRVH